MKLDSGINRDLHVKQAIGRARWISIGMAAVLSPIPLADELLLLPVYGWMSAKIGAAHGLSLQKVPWKPIGKTALAGLAARAGLNLAFATLPGVAAVANAISAAALTEALGRFAVEACADPTNAKAVGPSWFADKLRSGRPVSAS